MQLSTEQLKRFELLCSASMRALGKQPDARFHEKWVSYKRMALPIQAPHIRIFEGRNDFAQFRATSDAIAMRLRYSDLALHRKLRPEKGLPRLLFEVFEQFRVESIVPDSLPGVRRNLYDNFGRWDEYALGERMEETTSGLIMFTIFNLVWGRLTRVRLPELIENIIEHTRMQFPGDLHNAILKMARNQNDQEAFAEHACFLAEYLEIMLEAMAGDSDDAEEGEGKSSASAMLTLYEDLEEIEGLDIDIGLGHADAAQTLRPVEETLRNPNYKAFSTEFDQEMDPVALHNPKTMGELRKSLEKKTAAFRFNLGKLTHSLRGVLHSPEQRHWQYGLEEGLLDARRLTQIVTTPGFSEPFKAEIDTPVTNALVTFLVDNSGSMKRLPLEPTVIYLDILCRALELAGAKTEVLGFTTTFNGGKVYKKWLSTGRKPNPGRLNEARYVMYKKADNSWRRARGNLASMMRPHYFHESVDGEALAWGYQRALSRPEQRRIVVMISDGPPRESRTLQHNEEGYLERHLLDVIDDIYREKQVALYGIGLGIDLSPYYRDSISIDIETPLNEEFLMSFVELLKNQQ